MNKEPPRKILLCAPSNAAIDEVASRVRSLRNRTPVKVVRVGADKTMNVSVKDISLDYLVDQKLTSQQAPSDDAGKEIQVLRREIDSTKQQKQQRQEELFQIHNNTARTLALESEIKKLNSLRMTLTQQFDRLRDKQQSDYRTLDATRRKYRADVLFEADVICSTLSGAGHEILEQFDFDMVIIDEAAQAIELSTLIPLKYRCKSCIMVGGKHRFIRLVLSTEITSDPQQLPPTVLSLEVCTQNNVSFVTVLMRSVFQASRHQYHQSFFVRLQKHQPEAVHLLR
jgi:senataxin